MIRIPHVFYKQVAKRQFQNEDNIYQKLWIGEINDSIELLCVQNYFAFDILQCVFITCGLLIGFECFSPKKNIEIHSEVAAED